MEVKVKTVIYTYKFIGESDWMIFINEIEKNFSTEKSVEFLEVKNGMITKNKKSQTVPQSVPSTKSKNPKNFDTS